MLDPVLVHCPYCGEPIEILVDGSLDSQRYIEDCAVCCRPIEIAVDLGEDGRPHVAVRSEDDG